MSAPNPAPVPPPGSEDEDDDPEVCLVCGKPGRGQPCDDCLAELDDPTMRPARAREARPMQMLSSAARRERNTVQTGGPHVD